MTINPGNTLTVVPASVTGAPTPDRSLQWVSGGADIPGATASTYFVQTTDIGKQITVRQTETNFLGSVSAFSLATAIVEQFDPLTLFASGEQGAWYDPSDLTTMFQDTAGTTPVTATGQTVARINDKSGRGNHATQATAASRPIYQVDGNGKAYLLFDGTDDFLVTGTITPGTDKAQVFAGVRKLSDAASAMLAEFSVNAVLNAGAFNIQAPVNAAGAEYRYGGGGSTFRSAIANGYPAPITNVLSGIQDIAADAMSLRLNGAEAAATTTDQGTGNFLAYPLYIGRRGGTSLPFNGRIYQMIVRFGANLTSNDLAAAEVFTNQKTGAY